MTDTDDAGLTDDVTDIDPPPAEDDPGDPAGSPNREAASYRHRLRGAEASLAAAEGRLAALQAQSVLQAAAGRLAVPGDLLELGGVTVGDLLADDGSVDHDRVTAAVEGLLALRPGLAAPAKARFPGVSGMGATPGTPARSTPDATWSDALRRSAP